MPHSTVHAILRRHGCSRAPESGQGAVRALRVAVSRRPAAHGRQALPAVPPSWTRRHWRSPQNHREFNDLLGYDYFHAIVDDHSRLAYGELLADETAPTVTAFLKRGLAWFENRGIQGRRLMTDGAWAYTRNRTLRQLLTQREIRHIVPALHAPLEREG